MAAHQNVPEVLHDGKSPALIFPRHGVLTVSGYRIRIYVERGHLTIEDGIGADRRRARLPRVAHGLRRLVLIGSDGFVSLAAFRWLADQDASFAMLERDGAVMATTSPVHPSDARLRRAQALAAHSGADVRITRALISAKLAGQERNAREGLNNSGAADGVAQARSALDTAVTILEMRRLEARGGLAYWTAWRDVPVSFPTADLFRVPEHWRTFGARISPISGSPRCAANPVNAILNYLYAVLETESRLAAATVGLDPGLGFLHVDSRARDSLACDLMEPVRPQVDSYVLDWLTHRLLRRKDFFEMRDGTCRLKSELCAQLSQTTRTWSHAVAPWAELVASTLWATVGKPGKAPATPLTGDHRRSGCVGEHVRPVVVPPKHPKTCRGCGAVCKKTYCASCGTTVSREGLIEAAKRGRLVAHSPEARARQAEKQRQHNAAAKAWKPSDEPDWLTEEVYREKIQPRLAAVPVGAIASALDVSQPYATHLRKGSHIPHPRHWQTLATLAGVLEK